MPVWCSLLFSNVGKKDRFIQSIHFLISCEIKKWRENNEHNKGPTGKSPRYLNFSQPLLETLKTFLVFFLIEASLTSLISLISNFDDFLFYGSLSDSSAQMPPAVYPKLTNAEDVTDLILSVFLHS